MRKLNASALILTLAFGAQASAQADKQERRPHVQREAIELMLLRQKSVREDLKIDMEATKKIFEFTHQQHHAAMEVHKLPEDQQAAKWETMTKQNQEFLEKSLTPEQLKRLKQIALQTAGLLFVTAPKIARELNLTAEQDKEAKKLLKETQEKIHEVMHAASNVGRNEKLAAIREASKEKLYKLLTEDQLKKWKEFGGEAFQGKLVFEEPEKEKEKGK